jgi:ABC-type transporter Mla subunit MlaD
VPEIRAITPPTARARSAGASDDRPVVQETARHVALAAAREPATGSPLADAAGALDAPSAELARLLGHLRSTVGRYVRERRAAGLPVERVLPEVKGLVRAAWAPEEWFDSADALTTQVVGWTITAYYDEPEPAHGPRVS